MIGMVQNQWLEPKVFQKQVKWKKEITPCTVEDTLEILENDFLSYFEIWIKIKILVMTWMVWQFIKNIEEAGNIWKQTYINGTNVS